VLVTIKHAPAQSSKASIARRLQRADLAANFFFISGLRLLASNVISVQGIRRLMRTRNSVRGPPLHDLDSPTYSISAVIVPFMSFNVTVSTPARSTLLKVTESPSSSTRLKSQNSDFASRLKRQQGVQDHKRLHFAPTLESGRIKGGTLPHRCCMIGRRGGRLVQAASVTTAGAGTKKGSSDSL